MSSEEIRKKFLDFFAKNGHKVVPSSSLIPDDPSVLLTTAGMQQFKKYYTGVADAMKDFGSQNTVSIQKSFRTSDIDEVGDESHLTFFEMLGNFSFGGYFKEGAITYAYDFITKEIELAIDYVSVFEGGNGVPADTESEEIWKSLGVKNIKKFGRADNFWGPTGAEGPCGPTTEIYIKAKGGPPSREASEGDGKAVEIWNIVFNEYYCKNGKLEKLKTPGVDTGMGLERLVMVSQNVGNIFETDLFSDLMTDQFNQLLASRKLSEHVKRIILDHVRGIAFLIADGVRPSNKEAGYVLRRLIRRVNVHELLLWQNHKERLNAEGILTAVIEKYKEFYPALKTEVIFPVYQEEASKFLDTVHDGLKELDKASMLDSRSTFRLYESYGLPYEVIKELGGDKAKNLKREDFDAEFKKHQEKSRAGLEKKFGGHGLILNTGELKAGNEEELKKVTRLHTATHLLQQALRNGLGNDVHQAGSDITAERTRFDFTFGRKLTHEEIKKVEDEVNGVIAKDLPVQKAVLPKAEAEKTGALYFFREKYPDPVSVYYVGKTIEDAYSKEFCGGPHVTHTGEIGKFKIVKEEAVGAGVRRIRASVD